MTIEEVSSGKRHLVEVLSIADEDFKMLSKARYFFDWTEERNEEVYKLVMSGSKDILGLISIERIPSEWRIHIRLLTVSRENCGAGKTFEKIAGNLIAHVAKISVAEFGEMACISLRPKSALVSHYVSKYQMNITGQTLSLEVPEILDLIAHYDHDE